MRTATLEKVARPLSKKLGRPTPVRRAKPGILGWDELSFICEGLSFGQRPIRATVRNYSPEEIRLFSRTLHDIRRLEDDEEENRIC